jgi:hypothetical protein
VASDALEGPVSELSGRGQAILDLLDKAIGVQAPLVRKNIARARQRNPDATSAEVVRTLERMYVSALAGTGAAVGATAAAPAVGTGIALALSAGEFFSSLELSTLFVLSLAEVHGVQLDEIERRRTLVMGILLGESGSTTIGKVAERTGQHWARQLVGKVPAATLRQINSVLGRNFVTKYGTKQGSSCSAGWSRSASARDRRRCQRHRCRRGRPGRQTCVRLGTAGVARGIAGSRASDSGFSARSS